MNPKELYQKQYGENKLVSISSFSFLRKIFKKFNLGREDLALSFLAKNSGDKLLDVGCGNGSLMFKVPQNFNLICGVDISPSRIQEAQKLAKQKFPSNNDLHFSVCDIDKGISFPDATFNTVICLAVLEHIFDPFSVVREIHRILKNDGILILEVPNIAYLKYRIQLLFGKLPVTSSPLNWREIGWDGGHLHYFTKKSLSKLLEESGFKILKVSGCGLFAEFRNWWPSLLTGDLVIKAQKIKK
jgi:ubiquinone/menaquinone biosynthesis C-methylase UbiE